MAADDNQSYWNQVVIPMSQNNRFLSDLVVRRREVKQAMNRTQSEVLKHRLHEEQFEIKCLAYNYCYNIRLREVV